MSAVVLGAGGMLGRRLANEFPQAAAYTRAEADLTDAERVEAVVSPGVTLVLNAAAHTRVDDAETDPAHLRVNAEAVTALARRCREVGAVLVHVSTDYVFGGRGTRPYREDEAVDPVNAYGAGKLAGEQGVAESGAEALVVRTSWVYGTGGANFVDAILKQAEAGKSELRVVADQTGRPTYAADLARAIRLLVDRGARGIVHFANAGETTWFDFAREALRLAGREDVLVRPCSSADFPRPARRPAYSVLDTSLYERTVGEKPRLWREALRDYVEARLPVSS
ncbi:MAG TPA: dTDP-4-dehydrorhamnose reductase [Thermoanaerobaculia bacterium]|nr:dTDP-4-dehydrorhamnose reductase [Thermoanaerobaculia bacterium]